MYSAPILKKGIDILRLITRTDRPIGVSEIARDLSIVKSTALGVLKALEEEGFVIQDPATKKYLPGGGLYEFSREALRSMELPSIAKPFLQRLVELVDETVILAVKDHDDTIRVLEVAEPKKELKITAPVGIRFPLYTGALMKVFFSQMTNEEIAHAVTQNPLPRYTERSITRAGDLIEEVERTRRRGYATDLEEYRQGVRAIAAPVLRGPSVRAALSIFGLAGSMDDRRLPMMALQLKNAAGMLSSRLSLMARESHDGEPPAP